MTRNDKISKLARAVKDYRGKKPLVESPGYTRQPKKKALKRVVRWMRELELPEDKTLKKIEGFQTYEQFHAWLRELK